MQKISPFSVATVKCNKAVSGCVFRLCFWLVWLGLNYFLEEVGPWEKPSLGGNLVSCLVPAQGCVTTVSHPWWLWRKGAWHDHLGGCQHPLEVEHHFRGDIQGFASSFLGQKPKGKELERSSEQLCKERCALHSSVNTLGREMFEPSSEQKQLIMIKSTCPNPAVFIPRLKTCLKQNLLDFYHFTGRKPQAGRGWRSDKWSRDSPKALPDELGE